MPTDSVLFDEIADLRTAVEQAADRIVARKKDGSFLERTLRDALAGELPEARTEGPIAPPQWRGRHGGVDIVYRSESTKRTIGIETKVWDVEDSLYDILKLAAATQVGLLSVGYIVTAGRGNDWQRAGAIRAMTEVAPGSVRRCATATTIRSDRRSWARIWKRSSVLPEVVPATLLIWTVRPIPMPHVPDHEIRIVGVRSADGTQATISPDGEISALDAPAAGDSALSPRGARA